MKNKHGGKREGAGRNPSEDPLIAITVRVKNSIINKYGGKEIRSIAQKYLNMLK